MQRFVSFLAIALCLFAPGVARAQHGGGHGGGFGGGHGGGFGGGQGGGYRGGSLAHSPAMAPRANLAGHPGGPGPGHVGPGGFSNRPPYHGGWYHGDWHGNWGGPWGYHPWGWGWYGGWGPGFGCGIRPGRDDRRRGAGFSLGLGLLQLLQPVLGRRRGLLQLFTAGGGHSSGVLGAASGGERIWRRWLRRGGYGPGGYGTGGYVAGAAAPAAAPPPASGPSAATTPTQQEGLAIFDNARALFKQGQYKAALAQTDRAIAHAAERFDHARISPPLPVRHGGLSAVGRRDLCGHQRRAGLGLDHAEQPLCGHQSVHRAVAVPRGILRE